MRRVSSAASGSREAGGGQYHRRPRRPGGLQEPLVQGLDQQRVRPERGRDPGAQVRSAGGRRGEVALDVVSAAQQQRYEDGLPGEGVERLAEQRPVQLDVPEADVEAGAEQADPLQQGPDAVEGARVTAAVGDGDEGGLHAGTPLVRAPGDARCPAEHRDGR